MRFLRLLWASISGLAVLEALVVSPSPEKGPPDAPQVSHNISSSGKQLLKNTTTDQIFNNRAVGSKIFYTWKVFCPDAIYVLTKMPRDPSSYPTIDGRRREDYMAGLASPPKASKMRMRAKIMSCENCDCSDQGDLIGTVRRVGGRQAICASDPWYTTECKEWYGCRCEVTMHQPDYDPGITVEDYQNALDGVPFWAKAQNPYWEWIPSNGGGFSLSWKGLSGEASGYNPPVDSGQTVKELVPGTKEPYYLEGPDQFDPVQEKSLGGLGSPFWGYEGIGSGSAWKRSNTGEEDTRQSSQAQEVAES
ncbi:hypothetical protein TWF506_000963 [Arthrobotrys conoides]|uniref:Uncharacterized protein n=1 Tax=Arthrobotrys conoides TaxID=74498 RepID=A0AAN8P901_9PEZI